MRGRTGCRARYLQMGFEEMWGFNRQTKELLQIALAQVILLRFSKRAEEEELPDRIILRPGQPEREEKV